MNFQAASKLAVASISSNSSSIKNWDEKLHPKVSLPISTTPSSCLPAIASTTLLANSWLNLLSRRLNCLVRILACQPQRWRFNPIVEGTISWIRRWTMARRIRKNGAPRARRDWYRRRALSTIPRSTHSSCSQLAIAEYRAKNTTSPYTMAWYTGRVSRVTDTTTCLAVIAVLIEIIAAEKSNIVRFW